ncbi:DUF4374 domain-containing protein [Weeksellaceae bacterium TAE3-ERU29]|nr:DUF4374 domain-containing protein [Weeksellaceae bacterium TAE3-ERU29]
MKINRKSLGWIAMSLLIFSSCTDDNKNEETIGAKEQYVVAVSSGNNDYLVGTENLESTIDATSSNAIQAPGDRIWNFFENKVAYGFIYNQTDPSTTASYILNKEGNIEQRNELALKVGVHTRGLVNGELILAYSDRNRPPKEGQPVQPQKAYFYKVNPNTDATSGPFEIETKNLLGNGEFAYFTDIAEYEGSMIAGARSLKDAKFNSDHFNSTYVVVFNSDFTVKKVIKDTGRTGFVAGQKYSQGETGLEVVDNGDLYVFSSGQTNYPNANTLMIPSGILKINKGTMEFDKGYFFNITEASNGHNLFRTYYVGGDKFIVNMYDGKGDKATFGASADRFAIVDVVKKEFKWVTGIPKAAGGKEDKFSIGTPYIEKNKSRIIVPITDSNSESYLYEISAGNTQAKKLGKVVGESAKAIGKLHAQ